VRNVISISLPEEMAREMDEVAQAAGKPRSEIVKEALRTYIWEERFKRTRKLLRAKALKAGLVTDEDVFKAVS
jgi:CopG family transcriptional regulator/antitoxin EndoAI